MLERSRFEHELEDLFSGSHPTAELEAGTGLNSFGEAGGGRISRKNRKDPPASEVVKVAGRWEEIPLHRKAAEAHRKMVEAARADGIAYPLLLPTSGYRPASKRRMQAWKDAIKRYGSVEEARKWVAPPSTSPHRTGRAIDLWMGSSNDSSNVSKQKRTKAYLWLKNNAQRFGFYNYWREPWHWEYNPTAAQEGSGGAVTGLIHSGLGFLTDMLNRGLIAGSVFRIIQRGGRDENKLTNELFFSRHPERNRRPIQKGEQDAMQEWRTIRDQVIRPLLERLQATAPLSAAGTARPANSRPENTGPDWLRGMLKKGSISLRVFSALMGGERNENKLTDLLFHDRHPERKGRSIDANREPGAVEEWKGLRNRIVRPLLERLQATPKIPGTVVPGQKAASNPSAVTSNSSQQWGAHVKVQVLPKTVERINSFHRLIEKYSRQFGVDVSVIKGIIAAESGGHPDSGQGESGYKDLMQAEKGGDQLDPATSIYTGAKKYQKFTKSLGNFLQQYKLDINKMDKATRLKWVLASYNACPVTVMKAVEYAMKSSGRIDDWLNPENYQKALIFTGAYRSSGYTDKCLKGKTQEEVASILQKDSGKPFHEIQKAYFRNGKWNVAGMKKALTKIARAAADSYRFGKKGRNWRTVPDPPPLNVIQNQAPWIMMCWVKTKHGNTPEYLSKAVAYMQYFDRHP